MGYEDRQNSTNDYGPKWTVGPNNVCKVYRSWSEQRISLLWYGSRPFPDLSPAQTICEYLHWHIIRRNLDKPRKTMLRCQMQGPSQLATVWRLLLSIPYIIVLPWPAIMASSRCINSITTTVKSPLWELNAADTEIRDGHRPMERRFSRCNTSRDIVCR